MGVSLTWLLHFMVECFARCPDHLHLRLPARPAKVWIYTLEAEADEMWSFVQKKANKSYIGVPMQSFSAGSLRAGSQTTGMLYQRA